MTGKQLKNSILQWAIQGKLVPQDPNDEPASVLLEKIRAEKARLIKEGKIKKDKKESIIYRGEDNSYYEKFADGKVVCIDEEIPFEVPKGWEWCRMQEVIEFINGRAYKKEELLVKGTYKVLRVGNFFTNDSWYYSNLELPDQKYCYNGDLLYAWSASFGPHIWYGDKTIFHYHIWNVKYKKEVLFREYLYYFLLADKITIKKSTTGSTMIHVSMENMKPRFIPIPPKNEQLRIVEKIQNILSIVEQYDNAQNTLDNLNSNIHSLLLNSILQEAIQGKIIPQDPNDEPASVLLQRIKEEKQRLVKEGKLKKKDLVDSVIYKGDDNKYYEQVDGIAVPIESDYDFPSTWEVVRLSHICILIDGEKKEGQYICLDAKYLRGKSTGNKLIKGKFVNKGDSIILVDGENSGEIFTVPHDGYMGSTFKQLWVSCSMHLPYVLYFIQFYKDLLRNSKKGAAIPHLNKEIFYSLMVGVPPYQEQERIANRIEEIINKIKDA